MNILHYLELIFIKGIGNKTVKYLLDMYGSPENIFNASYEELSKRVGHKTAEIILKREKSVSEKAKKELEEAEKKRVKIVSINEKDYPEPLKEIPDPPPILYMKGNCVNLERSVSIVGSRRHTSYGRIVTEKFASELSKEGINIISGMASGIDTIAHESALKNGTTTAILGSGLDIIYPYENRKLYQKILENGCVVSEYPLGTRPSKFTFPKRNRLIAAFSYCVIVTEAPKKSGALITAKLANEYGRPVFSVPANINNPLAEGNNILLKEGAFPLTSVDDIKENLPYLFKRDTVKSDSFELNELEKKILYYLSEPKHLDFLVEKTGLSIDELMIVLFDMESKELIVNEGGVYIRR